jgi:purine-binding chemotaxis protein CheW
VQNAPEPALSRPFLLCRSDQVLCALPLSHVRETMRALPLEALAAMPPFMLGLAVIRGAAVPVLDLARLLGGAAAPARAGRRYVTLALGQRQVALAVDFVLGVRALDPAALGPVPALLQTADAGMLAAVGTLDAELMLVLQAGRLVPDSVWQACAAEPVA